MQDEQDLQAIFSKQKLSQPSSWGYLRGLVLLTFDLFSCPSGSLDGPRRVLAVCSDLLDHGIDPVGAVILGNFPVKESICQITRRYQQPDSSYQGPQFAYPSTPIADLMRFSVLFKSACITDRNPKMCWTYGARSWALDCFSIAQIPVSKVSENEENLLLSPAFKAMIIPS